MADSMDGSRPLVVVQGPDQWGGWENEKQPGRASGRELEGSYLRQKFREFFRTFRLGNIYIYRDALLRHYNRNEYFIEVDLKHVEEYDPDCLNMLQVRPTEAIPLFEAAVRDSLKLLLSTTRAATLDALSIPDFQILFESAQAPHSLRNLTAEHVNTLVKVPGIIISCSKTRARATVVTIRCSKCGDVQKLPCKSAFGGVNIPMKCEAQLSNLAEPCPPSPFVILADECHYIDQQTLKMQESPEVVPTGEMPRNILLSVDRYQVDLVAPGTRVSVLATSSLFSSRDSNAGMASASIRTPYLKVAGILVEAGGGGRSASSMSSAEEEQMLRLARDPRIYEKLERSIAPQISGGYTKDLKKAIACLLMGGSRKVLPDGVRLRGDINVLLMGDPSTAKSQFLKFVERVAPVAVYTSGKGSSAAGLTASVIKDAKGEFFLEGGAMVLADGGVICIDEFDKMRENDRVAIHEAMEQQTISIAKAGITTVLNSRVSVLAAANPIFGRYDDLKSVGENIELMTTILSRFDCIFIVRDVRDMERDREIARHVLGVHVNAAGADAQAGGDIDVATLKKFIGYCREQCAPRLNDEAAAVLSSQYVHIRNQVRLDMANTPGETPTIPITIRQLEALVRISESLAKMRLSAEATVADVEEALRLFKVSTLAASQSNPALMGAGGSTEDVRRAEEFLKRRMGIRMTVNSKNISEEATGQGHSDDSVKRAVAAMVMRGELLELNQRKLLKRIR